MDEPQRSGGARIGVVALNFLLPGLAWFRLGDWRAGLVWLGVQALAWAALLAAFVLSPIPTFPQFAFAFCIAAIIALSIFLVPIIRTWRASAIRRETLPWWGRWYSLVALCVIVGALTQGLAHIGHRFYKPFYAPSESMMPTIATNERFLADMRLNQIVKRGSVLLFNTPDGIRVYRVAALPGDRIAIVRGIPVINGRPATQRPAGTISYDGYDGTTTGRRVIEQLPGEVGSHLVLDIAHYPVVDDVGELAVPPGRLFVLGDNRDRAADSRVSHELNGVGLPAIQDIRGRPLFIHWSSDRSRIGTTVT